MIIINRRKLQLYKNIKKNKKFFNIIKYPLKTYYNTVIPLNIFQTWHTKNLPENMNKTINYLKNCNPAFKYYLFDDEDCKTFIKNNFDNKVYEAFNSLIPGAYKADLWRYCILYKLGGIYIDIKYVPLNSFKLINLTEKEHFVLDNDKYGIFNALMVCLPGNNKLEIAINKIVENVKNKYYGSSSLDPTGPRLLGSLFSQKEKENLDMYHEFYITAENKFIFFNNYTIFKNYPEYKKEQLLNERTQHYSIMWNQKNIYSK